jgi:predicted DNA binding CopG/RHH family protein
MKKTKAKSPSVGTFVDDEEKALAKLVESESFRPKSVLTPARRKSYVGAARAAMNEGRVKISLRIAESDLLRLKAKAMREGMPYQTLIGSILHKAVR